MVFRAGWRDPCTSDVARFLGRRRVYFYAFGKSRNTQRARITLSSTENHSVFLYSAQRISRSYLHKFMRRKLHVVEQSSTPGHEAKYEENKIKN